MILFFALSNKELWYPHKNQDKKETIEQLMNLSNWKLKSVSQSNLAGESLYMKSAETTAWWICWKYWFRKQKDELMTVAFHSICYFFMMRRRHIRSFSQNFSKHFFRLCREVLNSKFADLRIAAHPFLCCYKKCSIFV